LKRLMDREESISELQWLLRTCDALQYTAADCFILHFEQWFIHPETIAQNLLSFTGLDQFFEGNIKATIEGIAKPNLDRSSFHDNYISNEFVRDLYEILSTCHGQSFDRNKVMASVFRAQSAMVGFKGWALEAQKQKKNNDEYARLIKRIERLENKLSICQNKLSICQNSYAFRIGQSITLAVRRPGKNTLLLPFRLVKLVFESIFTAHGTRKA
jgi:hypothetical protein